MWHSPSEVALYLEKIIDEIGVVVFFNQAGLAFLRDAWAAAKFASKLKGEEKDCHIRLVSGEWPDFEIRDADTILAFECVEADIPGRRRGEEIRKETESAESSGLIVEDDPVEDWVKRADQVPLALSIAAEKKAAKSYSSGANLLIYLNIDEYGIRQNEIISAMVRSTGAARHSFTSVWVLWKSKVFCVWQDGQPRGGESDGNGNQ